MPYVIKHRRPPEPWSAARAGSAHRLLLPFVFINWLGDWTAYFLGKWTIFEVLEYAGSFSLLLAVIFYFAGSGDRLKQKHYQAWQVINTAQGKGGSGGRIEALQELNEDRVPLVGVDLSDAYLEEVKLINADLRRSDFRSADLKGAQLRGSNFEGSAAGSANFRNADFSGAKLVDVSLYDADLAGAKLTNVSAAGVNLAHADLTGADLEGLRDWSQIKSIALANLYGIRNAPDGFTAWAIAAGAVAEANGDRWAGLIRSAERPATGPAQR